MSGTVTVDGVVEIVTDAPGTQGHVDGSRHAERWAWAHCGSFVDEDAVVEAVTAQGRRGPLTTPYLTFVSLRWRDGWVRLSKLGRRRDFGLGLWRIDVDTARVTAQFDLRYSGFLAAGAGSIWISAPATFDDQCCP